MEAFVADLERISRFSGTYDIELTSRPMDDTYEPRTSPGREAAKALRQHFGR